MSKACRKPARTCRKPGCKPSRKPGLQPDLQLARIMECGIIGSRQFGGCACAESHDPYDGVKSNSVFGFRIPKFPIHCVTFSELSYLKNKGMFPINSHVK